MVMMITIKVATNFENQLFKLTSRFLVIVISIGANNTKAHNGNKQVQADPFLVVNGSLNTEVNSNVKISISRMTIVNIKHCKPTTM